MSVEANVLLASGQRVRNLEVVIPDATGAQNTVEMQAIVLADSKGIVQDFDRGTNEQMIELLTEIRDLLRILVSD
jgi:hypothetical protein